MQVPEVERVQLTNAEQALFEQVNYDEQAPANLRPQAPETIFDASAHLTHMLLERRAIPEVRLRYFTDSEFNIGGRGKSRKEVFVSNGCRGEDILRHPHFLKYLRYFILGPNLPHDVIAGFRQILIDDMGTSGMLLDQLCSYARAQARRLRTHRRYRLHEEFFKLAVECDLSMHVAVLVRGAVQSVR